MPRLFRVIVAGSRTATSEATYALLASRLDHLLSARVKDHTIVIVSGTARGADKLGERYAAERHYRLVRYPADWDTHGKKAGYLRNVRMAQNAEALVALWDGESRGTNHMITIAENRNLATRIITFQPPHQREPQRTLNQQDTECSSSTSHSSPS